MDDDLTAFEAEFDDSIAPTVEDVSTLDAGSLSRQFAAVERELRELQELHTPRTDAGRDLHSRRTAYLLELRHRNMM